MNRPREVREAAGLEREDLADAAHVPVQIIGRIEEEAWRPPSALRAVIAAALGEREAELLPGGVPDAN